MNRARDDILGAFLHRVIILVGHFGSGKSELAVNLALGFARRGDRTALADMDLIKPYFRSRLSRDKLKAAGVELIVPDGDRFYADIPIVVPRVKGAVGVHMASGGEAARLVVDTGGNDLGARALGGLHGLIRPDGVHVLHVINTNRPFSSTVDEVVDTMAQIEASSRIGITGLVANTHMMESTTPDAVQEGVRIASQVSAATGVKLQFCSVDESLLQDGGSLASLLQEPGPGCPIFPIVRHIVPPHLRGREADGGRGKIWV